MKDLAPVLIYSAICFGCIITLCDIEFQERADFSETFLTDFVLLEDRQQSVHKQTLPFSHRSRLSSSVLISSVSFTIAL